VHSQKSDDTTPSVSPVSPEPDVNELLGYLDIEGWAQRDIPAQDKLLGDVLTTTSKMFLVGRTGLGKTLLGMGIAQGVASGMGFLHWRSSRAARVLYIDGEMAAADIKERAIGLLKRAGGTIPPNNLLIFARDTMEEFAKKFPALGEFAPLNSEEGQNFVVKLVGMVGRVDLVILDNVMSLVAGDQKDEVPWSQTLPLVAYLTTQRIGQVWLDHTGHNTDRQYGSSTKSWRFDVMGVMKAVEEKNKDGAPIVAFTLSFDKARSRNQHNWRDFETTLIRFNDDEWTSDPAGTAGRSGGKVSQSRRVFFDTLKEAIKEAPKGPGRTAIGAWEWYSIKRGLIDPAPEKEKGPERRRRLGKFRTAKHDLIGAKWIEEDNGYVTDLLTPPVAG
jgi:hypothetical protein